jgi:hypothetical protein
MTILRTLALLSLPAVGCLILGGCASQSPATRPSASATQPADAEGMVDVAAWLGGLQENSQRLTQLSADLPGRSDAEHRQLMVAVFGDLGDALPALHGPEKSGAFDEQLRAIDSARRQLAAGSANRVFEPTIDYGLRAAAHALNDIQRANFSDRGDLTPMLDQLQRNLDQLDLQQGPIHRVIEADAVGDLAKTVQAMTAAIQARMGTPPTTGPAPATRPESAAL